MSYYESQRDERIAYALESIAKELGKMNEPTYVAEEKPAVETEEVRHGEWKAVEVVMCGGCKYYNEEEHRCDHPQLDYDGFCDDYWINTKPNDFCSYGERRDAE